MSAATGPAAGRMDLGPMRDELEARIDVINAEISALEAERAELDRVLGAMPQPEAPAPERAATRRRRERAASGRGRSRRPVSARPTRAGATGVTGGRPTAEQAERLVALLRDGPKGRNDIAGALGLSLTRTGQLLDVLGARVVSETDPDNPRRKRWRLAEESAAT
jgi:hypothetical protein